ncbi:MAG: hypothetical protein V2A74_13690 [bacterium]
MIETNLPLGEFCDRYEPLLEKTDSWVVKTQEIYLGRTRQACLIEGVAVENGYTQRFYLLLTQKQNQILVRLAPLTDPEKTDGVKRLVALTSFAVKDSLGGKFGATNIEPFLEMPAERAGGSNPKKS